MVQAGPICHVGASSVVVWARTDPGVPLTLLLDDEPVDKTPERFDGGRRWTLPSSVVPPGAMLVVRAGTVPLASTWNIELESPSSNPTLANSESHAALATCQGLHREAVRAMNRRQRDATRRFEQAYRCAQGANSLSGQIAARVLLARMARRSGDLELAQMRLAPVRGAQFGAMGRVAMYRDFELALLRRDEGDLRSALRRLLEVAASASRLGDIEVLIDAHQIQIHTLQVLGRHREALQILNSMVDLSESLSPERQGQVLSNAAWAVLLESESRLVGDGRRWLEPDPLEGWPDAAKLQWRGIALHRSAGRQDRVSNGLLNVALFHAQRRETSRAASVFSEVDVDALTSGQRSWWVDVRGRILLQQGRPSKAMGAYEQMLITSDVPESRWRARIGKAVALENLGRFEEAYEQYLLADRLVVAQLEDVGLGAGQLAFLTNRDVGARRLVSLAVRLGRIEEAETYARRVRARVWLRLLRLHPPSTGSGDATTVWREALDRYRALMARYRTLESPNQGLVAELDRAPLQEELLRDAQRVLDDAVASLPDGPTHGIPEPGKDERFITLFPGTDEWYAFVRSPEGVSAHEVGALLAKSVPTPELLKPLQPLRAELSEARRLRFMAHPWLAHKDLHTLAWGGGAVFHRFVSEFGVDIPSEPKSTATRAKSVLVVSNPEGNLESAEEEGRMVVSAFRRKVAGRVIHLNRGQASRSAVLESLRSVDYFHYSGHASGERNGLESSLALADDDILTSADVLAIDRVPQWVVLSGCETARIAENGELSDLGLAHAFVLRGSRTVVAAQRQVADTMSLELMKRLYAAEGGLSNRLAMAQEQLHRDHPSMDVAAFRALVP